MLALVAVLASSVLIAGAATSSKPRQMKFACASDATGALRYAKRARDCRRNERLVRLRKSAPIAACVKLHGTSRGVRGSLGQLRLTPAQRRMRRLPAGTTRLVTSAADCAPRSQPNEAAIRLPGPRKQWFCALKRRGTLVKWASRRAKCRQNSIPVFVAAGDATPNTQPQPGGNGNGGNGGNGGNPNQPAKKVPVARGDTATTDEDTPKPIDVRANDSDPDGDPFSVTSVDTSGTTGSASVAPDGKITYDPNGAFDSLKPGEEDTDTFSYRIADRDGTSSPATVTVTVTGVNDAPDAVDDSASTDEDTPVNVAVLGNDTDAEGDSFTIGSIDDHATTVGAMSAGPGGTIDYDPDGQFEDLAVGETRNDVFTYRANDGTEESAPATVTVTMSGVNDAPTVAAAATALDYTEGDGPVPADDSIDVGDVDGDEIKSARVAISTNFASSEDSLGFTDQSGITGSYDSGTGVLTLTGNASAADYRAALRSVTYGNNSANPSTATRTVSFRVRDQHDADSNTDTRDITVAGANSAPAVSTSSGATAFAEGGAAVPVDGAVTASDADDTNLESGTVRISSGFQTGDDLVFVDQNGISGSYDSGTGVLTLTGTASVADYQTALRSIEYGHSGDDPQGGKVVEFKVNDGDADSNAATKGIDTTGVNDGPTLGTTGGALAYSEGNGAVAVDSGLTLDDPENDDISGAIVSITSGFTSAEDELVFADGNGITGSYNGGTGVLTLSGTASEADYQAALRSVAYRNNSEQPSTTTRTVSFQATDAGLPNEAGNVATRDVTVGSVNDAPVVTTTSGSTPYAEGDPATTIDSGVTVTDADDANLEGGRVRISSGFQAGDDLVFVNQNGISGSYNTGTGVLTLTGAASVADYQTALRSVQYGSTNPNPVTSKTVEFRVDDGDADSNLPTKEIAVTPVNSPPTVTAGGTLAYTENDPATTVSNSVIVSEQDGEDLSGASVSITTNYAFGQDTLSWTDNNLADGISLDNVNTSPQTIVLTGIDSAANYMAALRAVTYANSSDNPVTGDRTVTFSATDSPGGSTGSDTRTIAITAVDDLPVAADDSATVSEDAAATPVPVLGNDTDVDAGPKAIASATDPANGTVVLTGGSPGAHTGLTYQPDPNYCNDPPGTAPDTFTYTLNGGSSATVSMTVTCVNDAPVADDETLLGNDGAIGNTTLQVDDPDDSKPEPATPHKEISGDILAGDTDVDGPGPLTVTPGTFATDDGGSVTIEADGDFTFEPAPATSCTDPSDFFDYTVEDSGSPEQTDTGRVTISIAGCVWYVSNDDPGNSGTSRAPFDTTQQAETASSANDTTFVYDGDDTSTGYGTGYGLDSGERLIGEHEGLIVDPDGGGALISWTLRSGNPGAHPTLTASGEDVVELDDGNEVRGLNVDAEGAGGGIAGASGDTGGGAIDDVNIVDTGTAGQQPGLELDSTTGTFNVSNLVVNNGVAVAPPNTATGVRLHNAGTVNFQAAGQISIATANAKGLDASATNLGSSTFDDITVAGSGVGGIRMVGLNGTTSLGDGVGTDLSLTTTSGSDPAFYVNSGGTLTVAAAGDDNISATGGPAVQVLNPAQTLAFDDVDSTNSSSYGIQLFSFGTGTFSATSGDITGASGTSFTVGGGSSGAVDYPGNLNNGPGQAVAVSGRTGGAVTLSGSISDTNDTGGTVSISGNTGGSTVISGGLKQVNTGASDAVSFTGSDGHALEITNGGLDIDTTSGQGLNASASGTVQVSGSDNTVDSTTGRALSVSDTDIGAADLTFRRISSNGAPTGIRLSNTGTNGNLAVTGAGGTCTAASTSGCSGGEIRNSAGGDNSSATPDGAGIVLNNTRDVALTHMWIHDHANYGIRGTSVDGFTLADSVLNGTNGTNGATPFNDSTVLFDGLTGAAAVSNTAISGGFHDNFTVNNSSGTLNRITFSGVNVGANGNSGNDGVQIEGTGSSTVNATVQNSTFTSAAGDLFHMIADGTGGGDLDFTSNTLSNNHPAISTGGGGVSIFGGEDALFDVDMTGTNTFRDSVGHAILFVKTPGTGDMNALVDNARVGVAATANSGSREGDGIKLQHAGGGSGADLTATVRNSEIRQYNNQGIHVQAGAGIATGGTVNATVTNNLVANPGTNPAVSGVFQGIHVNNGVTPSDAFSSCVHIASNSATGSGRNGGTDIRVRQRQSTTVRLPGYGGGNTDTAAVNAFLSAQNGGATTSSLVDSPPGGGFVGGAACPQ